MKSRIGSPKRQSSAAIRKKRMPREITEQTAKVRRSKWKAPLAMVTSL